MEEPRERELRELYLYALKGDLEAIKRLSGLSDLIGLPMTEQNERVLHIAAIAKQEKVLEYLVENIVQQVSALEFPNKKGLTMLCYVAITGSVKMAKMIHKRKQALQSSSEAAPAARTSRRRIVDGTKTPLYLAAISGQRAMVDYLYNISEVQTWTMDSKIGLLDFCIHAGFYGVALRMISNFSTPINTSQQQNDGSNRPDLALHVNDGSGGEIEADSSSRNIAEDRGIEGSTDRSNPTDIIAVQPHQSHQNSESLNIRNSLKILARNPLSDNNEGDNCRKLIEKLLQLAYNDPKSEEITRLLFEAADSGNTLMVVELIRRNPDIVWKMDRNHGSIFHLAVKKRHAGIFNLLRELGSIADMIVNLEIDNEKECKNILHLAAELSPLGQRNRLSGAALQMHRDALWFKVVKKITYPSLMKVKEVKKITSPSVMESTRVEGKTPEELFVEKHEELRKDGEKWMRDTAQSSMIVATLIATVAFTSAFSVPGGFDQNSGKPVLLSRPFFLVFSIADGIALFSSSLSLMFFLSILTSRYAANDFLISLPLKLMIGSLSLFISIGAMPISFVATFLLYNEFLEGITAIYLLYCSFAFLPLLYVYLNYHIFFDMIRISFACCCSLFRPRQRQLFY